MLKTFIAITAFGLLGIDAVQPAKITLINSNPDKIKLSIADGGNGWSGLYNDKGELFHENGSRVVNYFDFERSRLISNVSLLDPHPVVFVNKLIVLCSVSF